MSHIRRIAAHVAGLAGATSRPCAGTRPRGPGRRAAARRSSSTPSSARAPSRQARRIQGAIKPAVTPADDGQGEDDDGTAGELSPTG